MASGLLLLLDDVAAIAKVAAASIDDTAAAAARASAKAAGVVIDDAAVTPGYVVGFAADREVPIVAKIARGSLFNKLVILLPVCIALSALAPWAITPLLFAGGAFLAFEGAEKLWEMLHPHAEAAAEVVTDPVAHEAAMVKGAIRTDFILSAEIMAISLATVTDKPLWEQAIVLAVVAIGITVAVYGTVAAIVKADDAGVALAKRRSGISRAIGRGLVAGMPKVLKLLSLVGMAAMLWVGGGIILHSLEEWGLGGPAHVLHDFAAGLPGGAVVEWLANAAGGALAGLVVGGVIVAGLHLVKGKA
ncbi:DUF808 domain-containing protein [Sandaracinobacteroides saxicola]|uniref:DUF808 domain-containing protein n=1 Tax=Sandaracinobacteroides saxicola TaxID=2759707 RepID=A0A7G5IJS8_9SPHN|nr:DUF808 domain-containing protein [Sandaracinobacteroides saxicola]QMW23620.1 DUF808 domain-containing protein [Sandaracinobacteroides saxicola]